MENEFTMQILRQGCTYVARAQELDVTAYGSSRERAVQNLQEAVRVLLEKAEKKP